MYADALESLLTDLWPPHVVRTMEHDGPPDLRSAGWDRLMEAGFADLLLTESSGGPGLEMTEILELFRVLGRTAAPLPLAATWVARRCLPAAWAGDEPLAIALATRQPEGGLDCARVPGGRFVRRVLVGVDGDLLLLDATEAQVRQPVGDPRGQAQHMVWHRPQPIWQQATGGWAVRDWMAAATAAQSSALLHRVLDMTLEHCNQRHQFGRSIGQFQAVQHQLSVMAEHVLAASLATALPFSGPQSEPGSLPAAVAKARASEAGALVAASAHALHGAIGITDEHLLGLFTRRLAQWRMDYGSESYWYRTIGGHTLSDPRSVLDQLTAL